VLPASPWDGIGIRRPQSAGANRSHPNGLRSSQGDWQVGMPEAEEAELVAEENAVQPEVLDEGCGLCGHEVADAVGVGGIDVIVGVEAETTPGQVRSEPTAAPGAAVESAYCAPAVCWEPPSMAAFYSPRPNQSARLGRHIRTPPTPCPELALSFGASREQSLGSWPKPTLRHSPS
jgi:hypothetical protein